MISLGHHFYQTVVDEDITNGRILQETVLRRVVNAIAESDISRVDSIAKENPQFFAPTHGRMGVPAQ